MKIVSEFKEFISRGSVIDLAVGVIIGAAFGKIVTSLVQDIIMPPIGLLLGKVSFDSLFVALNVDGKSFTTLKAAKDAGVPIIAYGNFLNTMIEFLIVAACIFLLLKAINTLHRKKAAEAPAAPPKTEILLEEIRDLLKNKS